MSSRCQENKIASSVSLPKCCDGVSWSPTKTIPSWAIFVSLLGALMYLASSRASPSWTSSTGRKYRKTARILTDSWAAVCCVGGRRRNKLYGSFTDDQEGLRIIECILSFLLVFCALFHPLSSTRAHTDLPVVPDDRAPRRHTHSIPPQYIYKIVEFLFFLALNTTFLTNLHLL